MAKNLPWQYSFRIATVKLDYEENKRTWIYWKLFIKRGLLTCMISILSLFFFCITFGSVCSDGKNEDLLHEVILIVGYFTVLNYDNQVKLTWLRLRDISHFILSSDANYPGFLFFFLFQVFVQTGRPPTLLQHLCLLPFQYFSDPRYRSVSSSVRLLRNVPKCNTHLPGAQSHVFCWPSRGCEWRWRDHDGNGNDSITKQWSDWLNVEKQSCGTLLVEFFDVVYQMFKFEVRTTTRPTTLPPCENLRRKHHFRIELCLRLSILRLFHVGYVVQSWRSVLSLDWH